MNFSESYLLAIVGLLAVPIFFVFAFIALRRKPSAWPNRVFAIYLAGKGIWGIANNTIPLLSEVNQVNFLLNIHTASTLFFSTLLILFSLSFHLPARTLKLMLLLAFISISVFSAMLWTLPIDYSLSKTSWGWNFRPPGFVYIPMIFYVSIMHIGALVGLLLIGRRIAQDYLKKIFLVLFFTILVHYVIASSIMTFAMNAYNHRFDPIITILDVPIFYFAIRTFFRASEYKKAEES